MEITYCLDRLDDQKLGADIKASHGINVAQRDLSEPAHGHINGQHWRGKNEEPFDCPNCGKTIAARTPHATVWVVLYDNPDPILHIWEDAEGNELARDTAEPHGLDAVKLVELDALIKQHTA